MDHLWQVSKQILIDTNFTSLFYVRLLNVENQLIKRYGEDYDLDYIIRIMEDMKKRNFVEDDLKADFDQILNSYYLLRREKALEEGRRLFNPSAPCRYNSIFLCNGLDLYYWSKMIGGHSFDKFLLELEGNIFMSSDVYFPEQKLITANQVEESINYWQPKKKCLSRNEYLFQGTARIIK